MGGLGPTRGVQLGEGFTTSHDSIKAAPPEKSREMEMELRTDGSGNRESGKRDGSPST